MQTTTNPAPEGVDEGEITAGALRDALQQCFAPVAGQAVPAGMLAILARAAARPAGKRLPAPH